MESSEPVWEGILESRQFKQEMHLQANLGATLISSCTKTPNQHTLSLPLRFSSFFNLTSHPLNFSTSSSSSSQCFPILRTAISKTDLLLGKSVHAHIIRCGRRPDRFLTNNIITMYASCGSVASARHLFDRTIDRDIVTWNSILAAYAHSTDPQIHNAQEGFRIFRLLRGSGVLTSRLTLAPVLKLCLFSGYLWASEAVHGYTIKIGLDLDVFVSGALVNIYAKFGRIMEARALFDGMPDRDAVLWNVMLKAYVEMDLYEEALCLFAAFHYSGLHPDDISVRCVLNGINNVNSYEGNCLIEQVKAYATKLFLNHKDSEVFLWNNSLSEYLRAGKNWTAVECFINMIRAKVECDAVTFLVILSAIANASNLVLGQQVHVFAVKLGVDSVVSVANSLINMYSKAGSIFFARKVFNFMKELDLISWNSMISSCAQRSLGEESVKLFIDLLRDGLRPDQFTISSVLRACSSLKEGLHLCKQVHVHAAKTGTITDSFVYTALIDVYCRSGNMGAAEFLFEKKGVIDLASWNAMIFGYVMNNESQKALELFRLIHESGEKADPITLATAAKACCCLVGLEQGKQIHAYAIKTRIDIDLCVSSGVLDMYIKCGDMESAHLVFNQIPVPDDVAWTTMISGCVENGDDDRALSIYHQMRLSGVQPDEYTFATLVKATSCLTALEQGRQVHANVIKLDYALDPFVRTSLIDMYAKCGNIGDAYILFQRMNSRNIAVWNAILIGLAQHGYAKEALNLFKSMESNGIEPDKVTFIGVLSACSYSGLISEAYKYFDSMSKNYGIKPEIEHFSCLVDALGRAGHVQEAEKLIVSMPFEASASMYRALLGACWSQGNTETGKRVAEQLLTLEPSDSAAYVILSNIYAAANQWDGVTDARKKMERKKVKKDPGLSWIDVKE